MMVTFVRSLTHAQWIMLISVSLIACFLLIASRADAYQRARPQGQTMSHCGWLPTDNVLYHKRPRNVRIIQTKLEQMGYSVGPAGRDGKYGPRTRAAIAQFQAQHHLAADGVPGQQTASKLAYASHPIRNVRRCKYTSASASGF